MDRIENRSSVRAGGIAMLAWLILSGAATVRADMSGTWRIDGATGSTQFIDVVQVGREVTFRLDGHAFTGELSGSVLRATAFMSANRGILGAVVSPDETQLRGSVGFLETFPQVLRVSGQRCQCFDGNSDDVDGCNALCQIEECYTCDTPSSCVPAANGAPCDDGNVCSAGETCTEGICGDGSAVTPCIDLSGTWRWRNVLTDPIELESESGVRLVQTGSFLEVLGRPVFNFSAGYAGSIDPATGAFTLYGIADNAWGIQCGQPGHAGGNGRTSADGRSLTAVLPLWGGGPPSCASFDSDVTATRCGGDDGPCVQCPGDCNGDAAVTVDEVVRSVGITLHDRSLGDCLSSDADIDGAVTVDELVDAVGSLLAGCTGS